MPSAVLPEKKLFERRRRKDRETEELDSLVDDSSDYIGDDFDFEANLVSRTPQPPLRLNLPSFLRRPTHLHCALS